MAWPPAVGKRLGRSRYRRGSGIRREAGRGLECDGDVVDIWLRRGGRAPGRFPFEFWSGRRTRRPSAVSAQRCPVFEESCPNDETGGARARSRDLDDDLVPHIPGSSPSRLDMGAVYDNYCQSSSKHLCASVADALIYNYFRGASRWMRLSAALRTGCSRALAASRMTSRRCKSAAATLRPLRAAAPGRFVPPGTAMRKHLILMPETIPIIRVKGKGLG